MEYEDIVKNVFDNEELQEKIVKTLKQSMIDLGYSKEIQKEFLTDMKTLSIEEFLNRHKDELKKINTEYSSNAVIKYYQEHILPEIAKGSKVLDIGCGVGTLAQLLAQEHSCTVSGIDIEEFPEWNNINLKISVKKVLEEDFHQVVHEEQAGTMTLIWVLHHMEYDEQERYLKKMFEHMESDSKVFILEDSYSELLEPEQGKYTHNEFISWSKEDRHKYTGVLDWIANRVLGMKINMPVPGCYRTLEEWTTLFEKIGFKIEKKKYLGFPENRDVQTPQSVIVIKK